MGIDPVSIGLVVGLAALGTGAGAYSTNKQNQAVKASRQSAQRAAAVQGQQVQAQSNLERLKALRRSEQIRGRLRLAGAEAGLGDYGSLEALSRQNESDTGLNLGIIRENAQNTENLIGSQYSSTLARLSGSYRNTILSGFEGGLGGAQQGLQIGFGIDRILSSDTTPSIPGESA